MSWDNVPILIILVLSVIGHNQSVAVAAVLLLLVKLLGLNSWLPFLEEKGLSIGIIMLTISVLTPLVNGKVSIQQMSRELGTPTGIISLLTGVFVAYAAGKGLPLIQGNPQVVSSLLLGTIVGVCFFQGIAVGPLIAGGLVYLLMSVIGRFTS